MKYNVTIEFREYTKNVLKKNNIEKEYNLEFDEFSEVKKYILDRVYSAFETRSIHFSGVINKGRCAFNSRAIVGENMYDCQAYITNELYVPRS